MAGSVRQKKVARTIQKILSTLMVQVYGGDDLASVVIGDVRITPDLRIARIYYTLFGDAPRAYTKSRLEEEAPHIRRLLAKEINHLRYIPELIFEYDEKQEDAIRLERILDSIGDEDVPNE